MAKFLIIEARFYDHLNDLLVAGANAAIKAAGHKSEVITVPGALEIPGAIALADQSGDYAGYVAIGVVIRGETYHFEIVAGESARGLMALDHGWPGHRQRHPHGRERSASPGPRRPRAERQGRRGSHGGSGPAGAT